MHEARPQNRCAEIEVRIHHRLVPAHAQMVHRQRASDFSDFLVCGLGEQEVVYAEDHAENVARPFGPHVHCGPEAGVQGCGYPCCAEVGAIVEVCEGLGAFEANKFGEVAAEVEIEACEDDGLPGCDAFREEAGEAADYGRAVRVRSKRELLVGRLKSIGKWERTGRGRETREERQQRLGICGI